MKVRDMPLPKLPQSVQEIADVIGREKALYLIGRLPQCGKRSWRLNLYVPKRVKPDHPLVELLGWHDAQAMVQEFGGMILSPANCNHLHRQWRDRRIVQMKRQDGMTITEIAAAIQLSTKQVSRVLKDKAPEASPMQNRETGQAMVQQLGTGNSDNQWAACG